MRVQSPHYDLEVKLVKIGTRDDLVFRIIRGSFRRGNKVYSVKKGLCVYDQTAGLVCSGEAKVSRELFVVRNPDFEESLLSHDRAISRMVNWRNAIGVGLSRR